MSIIWCPLRFDRPWIPWKSARLLLLRSTVAEKMRDALTTVIRMNNTIVRAKSVLGGLHHEYSLVSAGA